MSDNDRARAVRRPFFFRCPEQLRERLVVEAEAAERSLTAEIVFRLRKSLEHSADRVVA
jgi:hypothetical protein